MFDLDKLVRENVRNLIPYSCARNEFQGTEGVFLDANENPFGALNRYPDPFQSELKEAISKIKEVPSRNIFLGNGSDEIIDLCYRIFCSPGKDKALTFHPTYGMYEVSAAINDVRLIKIDLSSDFNIDPPTVLPYLDDPSIKLIFICSPNNPSGNCMNHSVVEDIISRFSGMVVVDEAYNDFSGKPSFRFSIEKYPNLIVMQTFSKALGLAAARIGMAFTSPEVISYFNKMKPPYNISTINQKAALNKLERIDAYQTEVKKIIGERERLMSILEKISIIEKVFPSDSNFILVKVKDADNLYEQLKSRQIIIRNRNRIAEGCLRITVGSRTENDKLITTLKKLAK